MCPAKHLAQSHVISFSAKGTYNTLFRGTHNGINYSLDPEQTLLHRSMHCNSHTLLLQLLYVTTTDAGFSWQIILNDKIAQGKNFCCSGALFLLDRNNKISSHTKALDLFVMIIFSSCLILSLTNCIL